MFLEYVHAVFGALFRGRALDVGSKNFNGTNAALLAGCEYTGCDVEPGRNVTVVSPCHLLPYGPGTFDVIVSTECFEQDEHWPVTMDKIVDMLAPGGLLVFVCAAPSTRLTVESVRAAVPLEQFVYAQFYTGGSRADVFFVGIKSGAGDAAPVVPLFSQPGVSVL